MNAEIKVYDEDLFEFFKSQIADEDQRKILLLLFMNLETEKIIEQLIEFSQKEDNNVQI